MKEIGNVIRLVLRINKVQIPVSDNVRIENCLVILVDVREQVKVLDVNFIGVGHTVKMNRIRNENVIFKRQKEEGYSTSVEEHFTKV